MLSNAAYMSLAAPSLYLPGESDSGCLGGGRAANLGRVASGDGEVDHEREDAAEEDVARPGRAEPEAAVLGVVLRHEVADRGAERAGQDVGQPERQHGVEPQQEVGPGDRGDHAAE